LYINPLSNTYFQELVKWKYFRTGAHAVSKALMIFTVFLAAGIFISVYTGDYNQKFIDSMTETLSKSAINYEVFEKSIDEKYPGISEEQKIAVIEELVEKTRATIRESMTTSPIFSAYIRWLPVASAITVWFILEFIRSLILSNIAGVFSSVLTRAYLKILEHRIVFLAALNLCMQL